MSQLFEKDKFQNSQTNPQSIPYFSFVILTMQSFAINAAFGDLPAYSQSFDGLASRPTQISPEYPRISQGHNHEYSVALSNFLYPLPTNQVALPDLVTPNSPVPTSATPLFGNASNYLTGFQSPFLSPLSDQSAHQEILLSRSSWLDHLQTLPSPLINSEIPLPRFPSTPTFGIKDFLRGKKKTVSFQTVTGDGGQKMFCCPVDGCGKLFTRPYNLSSHTRAHNVRFKLIFGLSSWAWLK